MAFTHLHVHTEYSLLDGSNKIKEYVARVKELGMNSAAITDHGVMYGVIDFYKQAKAAGINPIIGCEVYVAPNSRFDRENVKGEDRYYHLVLLAENNTGYNNLIKIVSKGFVDGYYYRPRVDMEVLEQYHEGIIALSACLAGEVPRALSNGDYEKAKEVALRYQNCFGKDNYFLELQDHGIPEQKNVNQQLLRLSQELGIELVATNDIHYTYEDDVASHDILLCIQTGKKLADEDRMRYEGGQYYVKSEEEMCALFPYALQAIENTQKIADRCHVEIEFGVTKLPHFDVPKGYDSKSYLRKICFDGLRERYPENHEELEERLNYELGVIEKMGYVDYFLIVWDFIHYARENNIMVGPGRGSAAGSLVAYTTGITDIDPIRYGLLFERFLNPERVSMPDIDIDFCYNRRQEVIDYVIRKYGADCVTQIVTFVTLAARAVIKDVGRVMDLPYAYVDSIAKMVPMELDITIDKALEKSTELRTLYESDAQVKELIDMSRRLEGLPKTTGIHAAGVVISQKAMDEYVPLSKNSDGVITTQFTMTTIEELGLLKMDFLALRNLTVIQNTVKNIKDYSGEEVVMDSISYDDEKVLELIGAGKTEGIFQLESAGMKNFMKELKPHSLEDVIAGISLYRPGPMDFIPAYIKGKNDAASITYDCPQLEPILAPTYGCIVYQEQVMQIVRDLAGYSLGRSDLVRRAMSKKKAAVMEKERQNFVYGNPEEGVAGCVANGISEQVANRIYDNMIDFAKYAFNKSHAACYAVVAYQTAWLKCYYPKEYMAALMTSVMDKTAKISEYIYACRKMGISILPPDINHGDGDFSVDGEGIRYGLSAIKGVGRPVIEAIVEEREYRGEYKDLNDFCTRVNGKEVNKRTLENFIKAGAFDKMEGNRKQKIMIYSAILDSINNEKKHSLAGQMTLMDFASEDTKKDLQIQLPNAEEYPKETLLSFEKEVLGIYVSGHPLDEVEAKWRKNISHVSSDFVWQEDGNIKAKDKETVIVGGMITEKKIQYTKNNQTMAFVTIEDLFGTVETIVFPRQYEAHQSKLNVDNKIFMQGTANIEDNKNGKVICEKVVSFDDMKKELWFQFPNKEAYQAQENTMNQLLASSEGEDEVVIYLAAEKAIKRMPKNYNVHVEDTLLQKLYMAFGEANVRVKEKSLENPSKRG